LTKQCRRLHARDIYKGVARYRHLANSCDSFNTSNIYKGVARYRNLSK
jgi:hypothetical protein